MSKKTGRPTKYTKELATKICERIASGESLLRVCKDKNMPTRSTVHLWLLDENKKEFLDKYATARNSQAEVLFDELLDIADDGTNDYMERERQDGSTYDAFDSEHVQRSRLRVDTRKWYLSKVLPKKYGDKMDFTSDGEKLEGVNVEIITNEAVSKGNAGVREKLSSDETTGSESRRDAKQ